MKKYFIPFLLIPMFLNCLPAHAGIGKAATEVVEAVVKRCPSCRRFLTSSTAEKLIARGVIKSGNADEVAKFLSRYGDDGLKHLDDFGDDALKIFSRHGDEGMTYLTRYGNDYVKLIQRESPETIHKILRHPKGMVFLKESPDMAKHYAKYGDDLLECLNKNPLCTDSVKRTGLSPKILSELKDKNITWLEVKMPELSHADANAFRNILNKYGDPAIDFVRNHQDIFFKAGVFALAAANFDEILRGGVDVLNKTVETTVKTGGDVAKETAKETVRSMGGPYLLLLFLGLAMIFFGYRLISRKISGRKVQL
ncbi:MAG: hypothetical protein AB7S75_08340 [Desulfococcaceae bacterium]